MTENTVPAAAVGALSVRAAGRLGGEKVRERYGLGYFREIGRLGGAAVAAQRGREFYATIGKLGGREVLRKHGHEFFTALGKLGGETVKAQRGVEYYREIGRRSWVRRRASGEPQPVAGWGGELRVQREQAGLRQADLAARLGLSISLISHVETGRSPGRAEATWRARYNEALGART